MEDITDKRRKILLHLLLGIGLPCLLLGYLAFRGVQNDRALLEKERHDRHEKAAHRIAESMNDEISAIEESFLGPIRDYQSTQPVEAVYGPLELFAGQQPLVEGIFLLGADGSIRFPLAKRLFLAASEVGPLLAEPNPVAYSPGQQYEFQQKEYGKALISYKEELSKASDDQAAAEILNAIARTQRKSNLVPDAIESYTQIDREYSDVLTSEGTPLGLAALLELGALFLETDDTVNALQAFSRSYEGLIQGRWVLSGPQYEFYIREAEESIGEILSTDAPLGSYVSTFAVLRAKEREQRGITERLLSFQTRASSKLGAVSPLEAQDGDHSSGRFALGIDGDVYLTTMPRVKGTKDELIDRRWGLLLDPDQLLDHFLVPLVQDRLSQMGANWLVRGMDGATVLRSEAAVPGSLTASAKFVGSFPPWTMELYQEDPPLLEALLAPGYGPYLYMFILIAGILLFGMTLTIRIVNQELELVKMKSDFVSTVSHEFKSPLTSIRQLSEMLHTGRVASKERRQQYYKVLLEQSERLSLLIDAILDFSKMEVGKSDFVFERTDIAPLIEDITSTIQQRTQHEGIEIDSQIDPDLPPLQIDRGAITRAITNLIDNAIKYAAGEEKVGIRASVRGQYVAISVRDFGVGIKQEDIGKIFQRFYRGGDELTRTVKGSGLGLTLVKKIAEGHKGSVHVESEPGSGSEFTLLLPIQSGKA